MLLRIDDEDAGTAPTLHACAQAVTELAEHSLMAMVEPLPYHRDTSGRLALRKDTASLARAVTVASALGTTSAWTWLKMPSCDEPEVVYGATTLPCVVLGGAPGPDPEADLASWGRTLRPGRRARPRRRALAALPARRRRRPGRRRGGRHPRQGRTAGDGRRPPAQPGAGGAMRSGHRARQPPPPRTGTVRLTTAQALVRWMVAQRSELLDGTEVPLFAGVFAIFGHGNVLGLGTALYAAQDQLPTWRGQNEQGMALAAIGFARAMDRRQVMAATSSAGPGALNMVTAAGLAHANRLPVLLLPGDTFTGRGPDPVLQQVEHFGDPTTSVNDAFRAVSRYFDRITRPEQLLTTLPQVARVLTDPADNAAYLAAVDRALEAIAAVPGSVVVVSLGFDTYGLDPIGSFALTTDVYHEIGRRTAALGRRLVILQEGGYHRPSLGENARAWLRGAEGRPFDPLPAAGFGPGGRWPARVANGEDRRPLDGARLAHAVDQLAARTPIWRPSWRASGCRRCGIAGRGSGRSCTSCSSSRSRSLRPGGLRPAPARGRSADPGSLPRAVRCGPAGHRLQPPEGPLRPSPGCRRRIGRPRPRWAGWPR